MNRTYDIVIAGGGVIGASCAYQLSRRGNLRIAVVDDKRPGNATRASAGGLWAIGESVGLGCGVIFFRMMSSRNRREAQARRWRWTRARRTSCRRRSSTSPCNPTRCTRNCTEN